MTKNKKAFTLIELLVVVLIIGILAAIALPQYQKAVERARVVRVLPILRAISLAQDSYYLANGTYSIDLDSLDISVAHGEKDEEISNETRGVYYGLEGGRVNIYKNQHGVVWKNNYVTINAFYDNANASYCYTENEDTDFGEKLCSSLGIRESGAAGYYRLYF